MKSKKLYVIFTSLKDMKREVKGAITKRSPLLQEKDSVIFDSLATFRKFMNIQKIELLTIIANKQANSIYKLAKLCERDFAAVLRDCMSLENAGFIVLDKAKDKRGSKIPRLSFNYSCIEVCMSAVRYQIDFCKVA